jgi:hypothetical protein
MAAQIALKKWQHSTVKTATCSSIAEHNGSRIPAKNYYYPFLYC